MGKIKKQSNNETPLEKPQGLLVSSVNTPNTLFAFLSIILFVISILFVWLRPTSNCDLSIGIAQGKDVVTDKIGKIDDWSYMTQNKICMNQNWGADLVLYLTDKSFGGNGLIVLKLLLTALISILVILILIKINIPWFYTALFPAMIFILASALFQLRPDIIGILLLLLFVLLLIQVHTNRFIKYLLPLVLLVWTNSHGSYIFGFGLFFLFIALNIAFTKRSRFLENKEIRNLAIGFVISVALSMLITPYGLNGIIIPFRFLNSDYSLYKKILYEWQPVWVNSAYGNITGFYIGICLFVLTGCIRFAIGHKNGNAKTIGNVVNQENRPKATELFFEVFFTLATLVTIAMAASSRRFITYAIIFSAISCAIYLKQIFSTIKFSRSIITALTIVLIAVAGRLLWVNMQQYPENNVAENDGSFYERMFFVNPDYPVKLAKFIAENKLSGNIFCYWTWEGYLHYHCPDLKVFTGGRAHQIYDNSIFSLYLKMLDKNPPLSSLEELNTSFIAMPSRYKFANLAKALFVNPNWEILYADDRDFLFVCKKLANDTAWKSHLQYPDNESIELSSCAEVLNKCNDVSSSPCAQADSILRTNYVCPWYYSLKTKRFMDATVNKQKLEDNLLSDLNRFIAIASGNKKGLSILESTDDILQTLIEYYQQTNTPEKVNNLIPYLEIQKRIPIKR